MLFRIRKIRIIIFMIFFVIVTSSGSASSSAMLADLENALMCKCDDKCGKVLVNCTCSTSAKTRKKFTKMLESGLTVDQIIQQQVVEYGETVLSAPTKKGFNLTAWVMPFGALIVGGIGLRRLLNNWSTSNKFDKEFLNDQADDIFDVDDEKLSDASSSKYSHRLQVELDRLET